MLRVAAASVLHHVQCRLRIWILAFFWTCGLVCGIYYATRSETVITLMRTALNCRVSIVGLVAALFFPLFVSAISVYFSVPSVIYFVSFLKAFSCGYCLFGIASLFGSAGWLMRFLLLFSDSCMCIPLFWFWIRHIDGSRILLRSDAAICAAMALILGILDYSLVSPFLQMLMDYS